jgi:hypothetical protein
MECVNTIEELVEAERAHLVLELSDVTLADGDAAAFLASACEFDGIELRNSASFFVGASPKNRPASCYKFADARAHRVLDNRLNGQAVQNEEGRCQVK